MTLNARQVETAKPRDKAYKLADGGGLYLMVNTNGSKYWRMKYRFAGKEKKLSFGTYPDISLSEARTKRDEARKVLANDKDPGEVKKATQLAKKLSVTNTFEAIALEWYSAKVSGWSKIYADYVKRAFKNNVFPYLGSQPVNEIKPLELLSVLQRMEKRGAPELASKVRQRCSEVFRYAIVTGRAEYNPAADLGSALQGHEKKHYPFLTAGELPEFLQKLSSYSGSLITLLATRLLMLTGLRTVELRLAEWSEIDFDNRIWEIPKNRMKMKRPHVIPLSAQSLSALRQLEELTGTYQLIFAGRNDVNKAMSEASVNMVIKRIGYDKRATGHGFRHTMSTILHEQGFNTAWIEMQLAHVDKNSIRGTYNHAQYLDGRREMMQWYADYIDKLLSSSTKS
ncbi:tyrosine-type recombinase/integrase [Pantoea agglomerans]|uniref:tyrosine-type recombinase/integrase n=1 Tax=Enterobacter agglomerans TaxID=549 RepID=UPI0010C1278E|nr:integrase arm-type DNA-binding domain-containing protein [Pantoea agglomerans]EHX7633940.1 tyrosine-type recombinase/integrase [Salmonella enterica]TKK17901.1 integrase [Pantoea agglomerans]